jgi:putative ABC transport system permease protein
MITMKCMLIQTEEVKISRNFTRVKSSSTMNLLWHQVIAYSDQLTTQIVNENKDSDVVKAQKESDT